MPDIDNSDTQGIIMSGYGHLPHGLYLFLRFNDVAGARAWIKDLVPQIATGERWPKDSDGNTIKPDRALTLTLTHPGLRALGLPEASLATFPHEFQQGMAHTDRSRILGDDGDSAPQHWHIGGTNAADMHALLIVLAQTPELRTQIETELDASFSAHEVDVLYTQSGDKLPDNREHFGFFDGLSQPKLENGVRDPKVDEPTIRAGEFILGYENEYDQLPNSPTLNGQDLGKNGSYLVFRKLHQAVALFWQFVAANTPDLDDPYYVDLSDEERQTWLASKMVGRWPSGAPLVMAPYRDDPAIEFENYNKFYFNERDPHGDKCPLGSHIRRMNPRDSLPPDPEESIKFADRHQIIRRGLPYGEMLFPLDQLPPPADLDDDGAERGLIFICVNANIARQFEFIQQTWVENTKFHGLYDDKDPIIGDGDEKHTLTIQRDPVRHRVKKLPRFVQMRGGGYFFLPSISALRRIAALTG